MGVACTFTDASSDPQGAATITTRSWDFNGDGTEDLGGNVATPTFTFTTAGTFQAKLTVTDNSGNTDDAVVPVTVNAATGGLQPIASFTQTCTALSCTFTSTSTDDGQILSTEWDFGDPTSGSNTGSGSPVTHDFSAAGAFPVILTVTDNEGLTGTITQTVTVTGPTGQSCTGNGASDVTCTITLAQNSKVAITLESADCEIGNNNVLIPPPGERAQSVFFNVCNIPTPQSKTLVDDAGVEMVFPAGTQLPIVFRRGADPVATSPQAQITNTGNTWSISIDDGGNPTEPPDFNDVVLTVTATPQ